MKGESEHARRIVATQGGVATTSARVRYIASDMADEGFYSAAAALDKFADQHDALVEALRRIEAPRYGVDLVDMSVAEACIYWSTLALEYRAAAREALAKVATWAAAKDVGHVPPLHTA